MAKKQVELICCDEPECDNAWHPKDKGAMCMYCLKDLCEDHVFTLGVDFQCAGAKTNFMLGMACRECRDSIALVLKSATNIINERLKGIVADCVKNYAARLKEESAAAGVSTQK